MWWSLATMFYLSDLTALCYWQKIFLYLFYLMLDFSLKAFVQLKLHPKVQESSGKITKYF